MTTVEHVGVSTGLTYEGLVGAFERELGRWDPVTGNALVERRAPWSDVEREVERMAGKHGLMIFFRADQGAVASLVGKRSVTRFILSAIRSSPIASSASIFARASMCRSASVSTRRRTRRRRHLLRSSVLISRRARTAGAEGDRRDAGPKDRWCRRCPAQELSATDSGLRLGTVMLGVDRRQETSERRWPRHGRSAGRSGGRRH
jgi:hypothetical protein